MVFARSAAMAFNRYIDKDFDAKNPRTAVREIPTGAILPKSALFFTLFNCVLFIVITYTINALCFYLSPVALLVILGYSYTKRFTSLCHVVLGLGLSLAPIGAFLCVSGQFHYLPLLLSAAVLAWVSGFDIIYALQDEDFDRNEGLHSIPSVLGKKNALWFSRFLHLLSFSFIVCFGLLAAGGMFFWIGAAVYAFLLIYQQSIVKPSDISKVNLAFMTLNGIASVVFAIFCILDLLVK